jgi:hypothetical protein
LGELKHLQGDGVQSFNNDSAMDEKRNYFFNVMPCVNFYSSKRDKVPSDYLFSNVHNVDSDEIYKLEDQIVVGQYCDEGVIIPRTLSIGFNQLYNCSPLISLVKGDEEYISFLHTWAIPGNSHVVDKQVKHWMETIAKLGDISETVFAPRKDSPRGDDTKYENAIGDITRLSQKAIVLTRNIVEISGVVNGKGIYLKKCGYHLWEE